MTQRAAEVADDAVYIVGGGCAYPEAILDTEQLERMLPSLRTGWIEERLGIETRHVLQPHEHLGELGQRALDAALADAGWSGGDLDLIVGATSFVDDVLPATASWIARGEAAAATAFDVNAACASAPYAVSIAASMLGTAAEFERAAVCAAERPTGWADYADPESCVYWGDASGCLLLQRGRPLEGFRVVGTALLNDNDHPERVRVPRGGTFRHDGRFAYEQVCTLTEKTTSRVLSDAGVRPSDVRYFVGHQSNIRLLQSVGERLGIPWERQWHNVEWAGNQGGAGVVTAFVEGWRGARGSLEAGDLVLLAAVGGGMASGALLLSWETSEDS